MKRFVYILVGVVLIAFGIGALSLKYNDNLNLRRFNSSNGILNLGPNNEVNIGSKGLEVIDGDNYVRIGLDGIKVIDGDENMSIDWDGIKIDDGNKTKVNIGKGNWFNSRKNLKWFTFDEESFIETDDIRNINIISPFIDVEIISEDRTDIKVTCIGKMKANQDSELKISKKINEVKIEFESKDTNRYVVTDSDVILKIFIPKNYNESIQTKGHSSDIYIEDLILKNLNIDSSSGDIGIDSSMAIMNIQAISGDIALDNSMNHKDIKITSTSGNVYINFAKDANYKIEGTTTSGSLMPSSSLPMDIVMEDNISGINKFKGEIIGILGKKANNIEIKTTSGDVEFNIE